MARGSGVFIPGKTKKMGLKCSKRGRKKDSLRVGW